MKNQDPLIAEAKATYLVGRKAVEQGYKFVICEGDAMNLSRTPLMMLKIVSKSHSTYVFETIPAKQKQRKP